MTGYECDDCYAPTCDTCSVTIVTRLKSKCRKLEDALKTAKEQRNKLAAFAKLCLKEYIDKTRGYGKRIDVLLDEVAAELNVEE